MRWKVAIVVPPSPMLLYLLQWDATIAESLSCAYRRHLSRIYDSFMDVYRAHSNLCSLRVASVNPMWGQHDEVRNGQIRHLIDPLQLHRYRGVNK
jgi:hypothetical protein